MADRADAADARHDRRHLVERAALAELLEAAELGDVEVGVGDLAGVVEVDGDLGVALDAGDRVDDDVCWSWCVVLSGRTGRRGVSGGPSVEQVDRATA